MPPGHVDGSGRLRLLPADYPGDEPQSVDVMLRERGLDDPETLSLLRDCGVATFEDLGRWTVDALIKVRARPDAVVSSSWPRIKLLDTAQPLIFFNVPEEGGGRGPRARHMTVTFPSPQSDS